VDIRTVAPPGSGFTGGYAGGAYGGGKAYFAPDFNPTTHDTHGVVAIHDQSQPLNQGWSFVNLTDYNSNLHGFHGAVFTPGAVYFLPDRWYRNNTVTYQGWFSRYIP
jgi:hypothetical protein